MKYLVTGGTGFIGRHLVRELARNADVVVVDKWKDTEFDKTNVVVHQGNVAIMGFADWDRLLDGVDTVYHLCGLLGTSELYSRIVEAERVNVLATLTLLEAMRRNGIMRMVYISKPNMWRHNVYTINKENCERYLEMYQAIYGLEATILRPFNVYGPEERIEHYRKAVPYFIIAALKNEPLEVFGDGEQTMDLIYVRDCVKGFIAAGQPEAVGMTLELGSGQDVSVNKLASMIIDLAASKSEIKHIAMRKGETPHSVIRADTTAMKQVCGFTTETTLERGLSESINYYARHLDEFSIYQLTEAELV
jgi:UDP-glucose 4-epimerase